MADRELRAVAVRFIWIESSRARPEYKGGESYVIRFGGIRGVARVSLSRSVDQLVPSECVAQRALHHGVAARRKLADEGVGRGPGGPPNGAHS